MELGSQSVPGLKYGGDFRRNDWCIAESFSCPGPPVSAASGRPSPGRRPGFRRSLVRLFQAPCPSQTSPPGLPTPSRPQASPPGAPGWGGGWRCSC